MAISKIKNGAVGTLSNGLTLTSDDPTITMTDSSGTNDIGTIQATSGAVIVTARDGSADGEIIFKKTDGSATDETMRIDSSGNVGIGTTTLTGSGTPDETNDGEGVRILPFGFIGVGRQGSICAQFNRSDNGEIVKFRRGGTTVGTISVTSSATAYNTSSDHRLKEAVVDMTGAITRVKQLAPKRFNFIADPDDTTVDGFLAHEAQTVVPEAVTGTHNEVDADGNAVMQGIDQAKLVPLLTAALKESIAKIETLETEMTALKARVTTLENA